MNDTADSRPHAVRITSLLLLLLLPIGWSACGDDAGGPPPVVVARPDPVAERSLRIYEDTERPDINVLLISLDSVRRDYVSCYGYRPPHAPGEKTTPNLDALAEEGVLFEDYRASSSGTLQANAAMMTGQPDVVHGVDTDFFAIHASRLTLASVLEKVGYQTAGYYSSPELESRFGFDQGFDDYRACYTGKLAEAAQTRSALQAEIDVAMQAGNSEVATTLIRKLGRLDRRMTMIATVGRSAELVTDHAIAAIERAADGERPWFVFAQYSDPRHDYVPPPEYARRFDPDYKGRIIGDQYLQNPAVGVYSKDPNPLRRQRVAPARDLEHIQALYAAEIAWTDAQLGRLFDELRSKELLDRTLVVVTSDHGAEFFEHGGIASGSLFEEQLRVPLMMRLPGVLPAGKRVPGLVSHPDLMPTILQLLDLAVPEGLASQSAVGLIDGSAASEDRYALARLVQSHPRKLVGGPPIMRHTVQEAFIQGPIKIMRWRRWPEAMPGLSIDKVDSVRQRAAAGRKNEFLLTWTDLEAHPDESFEDRSKDFAADPRAAAALARFQKVYAELLAGDRPVSVSMGRSALQVARVKPGFEKMMTKRRAEFQLTPPKQ